MKFSKLLLLAAFAAVPAIAEEIRFEGRTVQVGGEQESAAIMRMDGTRHSINATSAQIIDKAQACLSRADGVDVTAVEAGVVAADVHADFRAMFSSHSIRSRMAIEATDGYFSISQSDIGYSPAGRADTPQGGYSALLRSSADWDNALETAIKVEDGIVDCLYR